MKILHDNPFPTDDMMVERYISTSGYDRANPEVRARISLAISYYLASNDPKKSERDIFDQINGINFEMSVDLVILEKGDLLDQIQFNTAGSCTSRKGQYYAHANPQAPVTPSERGIAGENIGEASLDLDSSNSCLYLIPKKITTYAVCQSLIALRSTSMPIEDSWSQRVTTEQQRAASTDLTGPICVNTQGGGIQLYIGTVSQSHIKCQHSLDFEEIFERIKKDAAYLNHITEAELNVIILQILILKNQGDHFLGLIKEFKCKRDVITESTSFRKIKNELEEISTKLSIAIQQQRIDMQLVPQGITKAFTLLSRTFQSFTASESSMSTSRAKSFGSLSSCLDSFRSTTPSSSQQLSFDAGNSTPSTSAARAASMGSLLDLLGQATDSLNTPSPPRRPHAGTVLSPPPSSQATRAHTTASSQQQQMSPLPLPLQQQATTILPTTGQMLTTTLPKANVARP